MTYQIVKRLDIGILLDSESIAIEDGKVTWIADKVMGSKYDDVRYYPLFGNLYVVNEMAFVWNFPARIFSLFDEVYIMTYLFDGQLQRYFYDLQAWLNDEI